MMSCVVFVCLWKVMASLSAKMALFCARVSIPVLCIWWVMIHACACCIGGMLVGLSVLVSGCVSKCVVGCVLCR